MPKAGASGTGDAGASWLSRLLAVGAGALGAVIARRAWLMAAVDPELRSPKLLASITYSQRTLPTMRRLTALSLSATAPAWLRMSEHHIAREGDAPPVRVVVFERATASRPRPAMLWLHGGGYIIGSPEQDLALMARILARLDIAIVSVDYRLAPEHPFPKPLDDSHAGLRWLVDNAAGLGVDPARIAVGGQSAGAGLAAGLVQRAVDQGPIAPAFQLLIYPMLDARTTTRRAPRGVGHFIWNEKSNRFGWKSFLGFDPARGSYPAYSVPAERDDLSKLPPAWIGVGTLDLFHDEDVEYGRRLREAGVPCDVHILDKAFHGFDLIEPDAGVTARFYGAMIDALAGGLDVADAPNPAG